jgi:hypothetical protein
MEAGPRLHLDEAERCLEKAAAALAQAMDAAKKPRGKGPWAQRADDLGLLKEEVVDIRHQIAFLKLEVVQTEDG